MSKRMHLPAASTVEHTPTYRILADWEALGRLAAAAGAGMVGNSGFASLPSRARAACSHWVKGRCQTVTHERASPGRKG